MNKDKSPLLFVDTNIILDCYRARTEANLILLKRIESVLEFLILSDQVEMEYLKNRQRVVLEALEAVKQPNFAPFVPAYLSDSKIALDVKRNHERLKKSINLIKSKLRAVLQNPISQDPVFKTVQKVFSHKSPFNLKNSEQNREAIYKNALDRFKRGYPPRKRDDSSMGDSINWEWMLECAKHSNRDVLVVSRDSDYGISLDGNHYLNDYLRNEFKQRVSRHRRIELTRSLAQALKKLSIKITPEEESSEMTIDRSKEPVPGISYLLAIWPNVVANIARASPFTAAYLRDSIPYALANNRLMIAVSAEMVDSIELFDTSKTHFLVANALKDIGFVGITTQFVKVPAEQSEKSAI